MNLGYRIDALHTATLMALDKAVELAIKLNEEDGEWTYVVEPDLKTGISKIEVIDEDGIFMGYL